VKTHYELLGLDPAADADEIKKAFRREIARYHPDKVIHLGAEFQEMAATRAAALTVAYKTLTDAVLRAQYDGAIGGDMVAATVEVRQQHAPDHRQAAADESSMPSPTASRVRFAAERADRDVILRRAIAARVRATVETLYGTCETPAVRDFDLAMVPVAKPRFMGSPPPRVLVRVVGAADRAAISDAFSAATRARLHAGKSPVVVLLFSRRIADHRELSRAWEGLAAQRRPPDGPDEVAILPVDVADWSCRLPPNCSAAVRKLADQLCA
jgi:curved DNA-binding protein CbpA